MCATMVLGAACLATGCVAASDEDVVSASQGATTRVDAGTTDSGGAVCEIAPSCALVPKPTFSDPLEAQLGCGPSSQYTTGFFGGFVGGYGSFCPDTPANRAALHAAHKRGFLTGYCSTCMRVPAKSLWVVWAEFEGPGCPSSCSQAVAPTLL
jgi:hypothetical protein